VANYCVSAREHDGDVVFLHRLQPGAVSRSFGVAVARLAGLPEVVLGRAAAVLASLEARDQQAESAPGGGERRPQGSAQLDLFMPRQAPASRPTTHPACEALRTVDVNRMTPLEALQLVVSLKAMVGADDGEDR
jgi:DNA mismatch repair protein MutS